MDGFSTPPFPAFFSRPAARSVDQMWKSFSGIACELGSLFIYFFLNHILLFQNMQSSGKDYRTTGLVGL